ncbi:hypothetical protein FQZ97_958130 [compost metagenome]
MSADVAAEVALQTPYGYQGLSVHAVALFDARKGVAVLQQQALTAGDSQRGDCAIQVFPYRSGKFRLAAVGDQHVGVGADAGEGAIEQRGVDAGGNRIAAQQGTPVGEAEFCGGNCRLRQRVRAAARAVGYRGQRLRGRLGTGRQEQEEAGRGDVAQAANKQVGHGGLKTFFLQAATLARLRLQAGCSRLSGGQKD